MSFGFSFIKSLRRGPILSSGVKLRTASIQENKLRRCACVKRTSSGKSSSQRARSALNWAIAS